MKKLYLIIACLFITLCSYSQNAHLDFKGIPLDGRLSDFISKLEAEGFTFDKYVDEDAAIMKGDFAGRNADIYILVTPSSKTVYAVSVFYNEDESWSSLKSDYFQMKELYTKKYGEPESFEFFSKPYYEGDGYELQALRKGKCNYESLWELPLGRICIKIDQFCEISMIYGDKINTELRQKEDENIALNDI